MDRLFLGLVAGAAVGAVLGAAAYILVGGLRTSVGEAAIIFVFALIFTSVTMPLVFAPIWFALDAVGLRRWIGATVAGAVAFLLMPFVLGMMWTQRMVSVSELSLSPELSALPFVGAVAGFVAWRVARWEVVPSEGGGTQ